MNFVSIKGQQQLGSGLRLTVAVEVRAGSFQPPGSPIAYASTDEGGFAIALCDGSSDWGDGAHRAPAAAATIARSMIAGNAGPVARFNEAIRAAVQELRRGEIPPDVSSCLAAAIYLREESATGTGIDVSAQEHPPQIAGCRLRAGDVWPVAAASGRSPGADERASRKRSRRNQCRPCSAGSKLARPRGNCSRPACARACGSRWPPPLSISTEGRAFRSET